MAQSFPVLLVRHAPVMVPEGVCYGRQDVALRPGWERVTSGLAVLAQGAVCRVLYTSPAARCQQMARKLAASTGMELRIDPRLAEMNFGEWEGRLWQDIDRGLLDAWAADPEGFVPPGGESGRALCHRVRAFWQEVQQASTPACVLSHGGPLRVLSALAAGTPPALLAPSMPQGFARLFMVGASPDLTPETEEDAAPQSRRETGAPTGSKTSGSVTQRLLPVVPLWPRRHRPVPAEPALTFPKTDTGPALT